MAIEDEIKRLLSSREEENAAILFLSRHAQLFAGGSSVIAAEFLFVAFYMIAFDDGLSASQIREVVSKSLDKCESVRPDAAPKEGN